MVTMHSSPRCGVGILLLSFGCGVTPEPADDSTTTSTMSSQSSPSSTSEAASSDTSASSAEQTSVGSSSGSTDSSSSAAESETSTSTGSPSAECEAAATEQDCLAAADYCGWHPVWRVDDVPSCEIVGPEFECWGQPGDGPQGCFSGVPTPCDVLEVQPVFREVRGELWIMDFQGPCTQIPEDWIPCHNEEAGKVPEQCYCLCESPETTGE